MDLTTLALAKKYTNSQRIGYAEKKETTLTYDGTGTRLDFGDIGTYVKILDQPADLSGVYLVRFVYDGNEYEFHKDEILVQEDHTVQAITVDSFTVAFVLSVTETAAAAVEGVEPGTYVLDIEESMDWPRRYITEVHGAAVETVHKIDPKFIPTYPIIDMPDNNPVEISLELAQEIYARATAAEIPFAIRIVRNAVTEYFAIATSADFTKVLSDNTMHFTVILGEYRYTATINGGGSSATLTITGEAVSNE